VNRTDKHFAQVLDNLDDGPSHPQQNRLIHLGIADDVLRDLFRRGKVYKPGKMTADPMLGLYAATVAGKTCIVEYEPDSDLRDTEQVPLLEDGGIKAFIRREVLPHVTDAWYDPDSIRTGYEISFTRYFYKPQPLRSLEEIRADILALERETDGLLSEIVGAAP